MAALEAVGADVGEVVRDGVQLRLLGLHAGLADPKRTHHGDSSTKVCSHDRPDLRPAMT